VAAAGGLDRFRLWWVEHAPHIVPRSPAARTRVVEYGGVYGQAVHDLVRWVEDGVEPPPSTTYSITDDGELVLPSSAAARGGVQPVVSVSPTLVGVGVGKPFTLSCTVDVPAGGGDLVAIEWDLAGEGAYERRGLDTTLTHAYDSPGTYFVTVRAASERDAGRIWNLARARVVVS
jgi:hypothetical protein